MKISFTIDVGIDVENFVQAGWILDNITQDLKKSLGSKGEYDIRNFQTIHTPIHRYASEVRDTQQDSPMSGAEYAPR